MTRFPTGNLNRHLRLLAVLVVFMDSHLLFSSQRSLKRDLKLQKREGQGIIHIVELVVREKFSTLNSKSSPWRQVG